MKPFCLLVLIALTGCTKIESHKQGDGSTCHDIQVPVFHYSDCDAPKDDAR